MKHNLFRAFFLSVIFAGLVFAQKPQAARLDPVEANLRRTIEYLASDKLEGRRTGEPGATLAADYISKQFAGIGLKPGFRGSNGKSSFLQPFPYVTGVEMDSGFNTFSIELAIADGKRAKLEHDVPEKPVGFSPNGSVENAKVVFAGFGIVSPEQKFDDYAGLDVKGRIVLVFDGTPDNDNPHSPFGRFDARTKALIAKDKGAVGVLLISREDKFEDDRLTRLGYDQSLGEAALPTFVIDRSTAKSILGCNYDDLKKIEADTVTKNGASVSVLAGFRDTQTVVGFHVNLTKKQAPAYNVIGILPGTDPTLKNEAIVIGAHYDHLGHGGQGSLAANSTEIHHGADDNASGVAAIIEMARQFKSEPGAVATGFRNKRTLIFIAFSGEEEGLFGSNFYVNNPVFPLDKTIAMINLDMVGRLKDDKLTIGGIGTASQWREAVTSINSGIPSERLAQNAEDAENQRVLKASLLSAGLNGVRVGVRNNEVYLAGSVPMKKLALVMRTASEMNPRKIINNINISSPGYDGSELALQLNEDGFGPSDHSSFYGKKVPVLFFFTGTHNDYHKPSDTADKINYAGEVNVINYVEAIERDIDQNPQRPTYTVAKTTMAGGRSGFNISLGTIPNYADSTDGLLLDGVRDGSPAAKAGVKAGDKVVKLAGHDIRNVMDYTYVLGEMKAGVEYEMVVLRGTERLTLKIVPVKR